MSLRDALRLNRLKMPPTREEIVAAALADAGVGSLRDMPAPLSRRYYQRARELLAILEELDNAP